MWLWHPELSEIDAWFETKTKEFAKTENRNPNRDSEAWLQKYIYTDVHEVLFATIPSELHSWLARLADCSGHVQSDRPAQWNQAAI
jgi:NADH:ubiquinone oxidoreductase subunit